MAQHLLEFFRRLLSAFIIVLVAFSSVAFADDDDEDEVEDELTPYQLIANDVRANALRRKNIAIRLKPLGFGLMGDHIDHDTGSLQFKTTDISIPGNSRLPVQITRIAQGPTMSFGQKNYMADWSIELPSLTLDIAEDRFYISKGKRLYIPGYGFQYEYNNGVNPEGNGTAAFDEPRWGGHSDLHSVTKDHVISYYEGYTKVVITPDGTKYELGKILYREAGDAFVSSKIQHDELYPKDLTTPRKIKKHLITEVTDKDQNWVKYEYDGDYLTRIHSNDGREIKLYYISVDGTKYVSSITANGRTWTYQYKTVNDIDRAASSTRKLLHKVIQPDGKYWEYNIDRLVQDEPNHHSLLGIYRSNPTITVKHPYGAEATYELGVVIQDSTMIPSGSPFVPGTFLHHKSKAAFSKKLLLTGGKETTWKLGYRRDFNGFWHNGNEDRVWGYGESIPQGYTTVIIKPDGTRIEKGYNLDGDLKRSRTLAPNSTTVLKQIENEYISTTHSWGQDPGVDAIDEQEEYDQSYKALLSKRVVTQNGDVHTTEYSYDLDPWSPTYSYNRPIETKVYTNVGGSTTPRVTKRNYEHIHSKWILNLLDKVTTNDREIASFDYDTFGRVTHVYRYGQLDKRYEYYPVDGTEDSGTLRYVYDALDRKTTAARWKRGVPQLVGYADSTYDYRFVDDNGWPIRDKDARGAETLYDYDSMGRVTLVDAPGNWDSTVIDYDFNANGAVQTITKGQSRETVTYDNLFRVVLERTQALDTGWSSYTNKKYNSRGLVSFKSQPSTNPYETKGMDYTYDGLGRIYTERENVAPYATTSHRYYSSFRHRIHDPSGAWTDYYSYGYDGPGNKDYRAIYHYADGAYQRHTYLYKNVHGQLTRLRQWGNQGGVSVDQSQTFYYNSQQRLCRHYVPEHGATKYQYNLAGEMIAYAKGQADSGCGTVPNVSAKVSLSYDDLGRLEETNFADPATPDITRTYDANGNVLTVDRDGVDWTYTYNELNLLTSERLDIDGRSFTMSYNYNSSGHIIGSTMPHGPSVSYTPDGLGRAISVESGTVNLANNVSFHANGMPRDVTYGNGTQLTQVLNNRLLLGTRRVTNNIGTALFDQQLAYDARARITSLTDNVDNTNSRSYGYDGLGQLTSSTGPWGTGAYTYDSLGNLRTKTEGPRTVNLSYDSRNRLTQSADSGATGTRTLDYDPQGNVTTLGNLAFLYDYSDQPVVVTGSADGVNHSTGAANGNYVYDGNLKRVKSVINGKTNYWVYNAAGKIVYNDEATLNRQWQYIYAAGENVARCRVQADGSCKMRYMVRDYLGSVALRLDETGGIKKVKSYAPFGEELEDDHARDSMAFTGHIRDEDTGLNYMQARYYDPVIGRFLSIDPVTFMDKPYPGQFNRYAYTWNDPVNANDPDGEFLNLVIGGAVGFVLDVAVQKISDPDGKIDIRQAAISGAAGAVGAGIGAKIAQGFSALGMSNSLAHGAHQVAAGAAINTTAGVANNLTDGNAQTKALDGAGVNAATGALGAAGGVKAGQVLDRISTGLGASLGTSAARGAAKAVPDIISNFATQTPNMDFNEGTDLQETRDEPEEEQGG